MSRLADTARPLQAHDTLDDLRDGWPRGMKRALDESDGTWPSSGEDSPPASPIQPVAKRARAAPWELVARPNEVVVFLSRTPHAHSAHIPLLLWHAALPGCAPRLAFSAPTLLARRSAGTDGLVSLTLAVRDGAGQAAVVKVLAWPPGSLDAQDFALEEALNTHVFAALRLERLTPAFLELHCSVMARDLRLPWSAYDQALRRPDGASLQGTVLVSDRIAGGKAVTLAPACTARGVPSGAALASAYAQLVWALACLDAASLVHLDIQPDNLLLDLPSARAHAPFQLVHAAPAGVAERVYDFTCAGRVPHLRLIDYGLSQPAFAPTFFVPTALYYRPPEFVLPVNAQRAATDMQCAPPTHYTHAADVWSAAASFVTVLCAGIVPGFARPLSVDSERAGMPNPVPGAPELWHPPYALVEELSALRHRWRTRNQRATPRQQFEYTLFATVASSADESDDVHLIAIHLWRLVRLLGLPRERHWPGIERTPVWRIVAKHAAADQVPDASDDPYSLAAPLQGIVTQALDTYAADLRTHERNALTSLLAQQLQWNPALRPAGSATLIASASFALLCQRFSVSSVAPAGVPWNQPPWRLTLTADGKLAPDLLRHITASMDSAARVDFTF
jgi:serine/threonine protein kinase